MRERSWRNQGRSSAKVLTLAGFLLASHSACAWAVSTSLAVRTSSGPAAAPPALTELPNCDEVNPQSRALGATDDPQVTKIEGGGKKYSYDLPGGQGEYITVSEPPEGFDPLTATDAELHTWGFPPRPSNEAGMKEWRSMVGGYKEASFHESCRNTDPEVFASYLGEEFSPPWSGYEDVARGNQTKWHAVMGNFYAAQDHGSACGNINTNVGSWVGLGGDGSIGPTRFMQAGIDTVVNEEPVAWIEWWTANAVEPYAYWPVVYRGGAPFKIEPTNYIRMYVGYNYSLEEFYAYFTNDHTGQTELVQTHLGHQFYNGDTAEWIDEALGSQPLLNFKEITWWDAVTQNERNELLPATAANFKKDVTGHGPSSLTMWPGTIWNGENWTDFYYKC
jgi:hypothetical protein